MNLENSENVVRLLMFINYTFQIANKYSGDKSGITEVGFVTAKHIHQ